MAAIDWDDSYSVGVEKLDAQHKILFELINKACVHTGCDGDEALLRQLAANMMAYAFMHFSTEEEFMQIHDYPEEDSHTKMHEDFKVFAMQHEIATQQGTADYDKLIKYLIDWLNGHVRGTDHELGIFLNEKGIF